MDPAHTCWFAETCHIRFVDSHWTVLNFRRTPLTSYKIQAHTPEFSQVMTIAVARNLAAHLPTRRGREQSFSIPAEVHREEHSHKSA
ncbi:hypothetical protein AArcSl_1270 [Halalkaliarchaeum desulfuricum]|uniref:Uncharacterized protein n=1 Tax=Halalkaliarchaeum desulfuricum TaxID=2055893 RepID=A0A343TII0_9EURY|nr:hypothetical protein AArcSl_1270 [Halalkaliarchaeum desulfuricum]